MSIYFKCDYGFLEEFCLLSYNAVMPSVSEEDITSTIRVEE
jgi:hypothetical protein